MRQRFSPADFDDLKWCSAWRSITGWFNYKMIVSVGLVYV